MKRKKFNLASLEPKSLKHAKSMLKLNQEIVSWSIEFKDKGESMTTKEILLSFIKEQKKFNAKVEKFIVNQEGFNKKQNTFNEKQLEFNSSHTH